MSAGRTSKRSKQRPSPSRGYVDLERALSMTDEEIEATSDPELKNLPPDFLKDAVVVFPEPKEPISLRVDQDVLTWFREGGPGYQSRMNAVLRSYMTSMESQKKKKRPSRANKSRKRPR